MAEWQPIETAPKDGTPVLLVWHWDSGVHKGVSVVLADWGCATHSHLSAITRSTKGKRMKIERSIDGRSFFVYREMGGRRDYFSFYVDDDKSSWSQYPRQRQRFISRQEAADAIIELRRRKQLQRKRSRAGIGSTDLRRLK